MTRTTYVLLAALALLAPQYSAAHPDWYLARLKPPNGGQLRNAGTFHMELIVTPKEIRLYVSDHFFNKFPTKTSRATAVLVSGEKLLKVNLTPGGENLLMATGDFPQETQLKVAILLDANRYGAQAARFTPFQNLGELAPPAQRIEDLPAAPEALQRSFERRRASALAHERMSKTSFERVE